MMNKSIKRHALGEFLKTVRARVTPAMAGLPSFGRRRTSGLRREEVAQLCNISVTWYTWIEQGREVQVSSAVWARLADALSLNPTERAYLFELAEVADPELNKGQVASLPLALARCVNEVNDPCYILDRYWDILYFNDKLNDLFGNWPAQQERPNLLNFIFFAPQAKLIVVDWEDRARRLVGEFRADVGAYLEESQMLLRMEQLMSQSERFKYWWNRQTVQAREGGTREFYLPDVGCLQYEQITFRLATNLDYKLVMLLSKQNN